MRYFVAILFFVGFSGTLLANPSSRIEAGDFYFNLINGNLMIVQTYEPPTENGLPAKKYSVVKLTLREKNTIPTRVLPDRGVITPSVFKEYLVQALAAQYISSFVQFIEKFVMEQYAARGDAEAPSEIAKERPFLEAPSTWVVITDHNNLEKIHAVFRVVQRDAFRTPPDPNEMWRIAVQSKTRVGEIDMAMNDYIDAHEQIPRLDVENRLNFDLPALPIRMDPETKYTYGGWAEIKSLMIDSKPEGAAKEEFLKVLLYALTLHGQHALLQASQNIPFTQFSTTDGLSALNYERFISADHFVIDAIRPGLVRLYERLGFKVMRTFAEKHSWVMTANLHDFETKTVSQNSDKGVPFRSMFKNEGAWQPTPLFPPAAYEAFQKDRRIPPRHSFEDVEVVCRSSIGRLGTRFYTHVDSNIQLEWNLKQKR